MKTVKKNYGNCSGFSMVELLVAISLSSIIMIMLYSSNNIILESIKNFSKVSEFYREYNLFYYRLDTDISSVYFNAANSNLPFTGTSDEGRTANSTISFVTVSKNDYFMNQGPDRMTMTSDIKLVEYFLKKDPAYPDLNFLIRKEYIMYNVIPGEFEEAPVKNFSEESILLKNVKDMKAEYYFGTWEDKWDSSNNKKLPKLVRISLQLNDYNGKEHSFSFVSKPGMN